MGLMLELEGGKPVPTKGQMMGFLEIMQGTSHIGVDTESDPDTDLFLGFSIACGEVGMYFPVGHLEADANIDDEVYDYSMNVIDKHELRVFQHAGYDLSRYEHKLGIPLQGRFVCTMTMAHMINENLVSKSLDSLHKHYVKNGTGKEMPELMKNIIKQMGWRYVPAQLMTVYGTQDAVAASQLFLALKPLYTAQFGELFS